MTHFLLWTSSYDHRLMQRLFHLMFELDRLSILIISDNVMTPSTRQQHWTFKRIHYKLFT